MRLHRLNLCPNGMGGLIAIVSSLYVSVALAAETGGIGMLIKGQPLTPIEVKRVEPVCALIFANSVYSGQTWYEKLRGSPLLDEPQYVIAKGAHSFHHYCFAEVSMLRYYNAVNAKERTAYALSAAGDYGFVVDHPEYRSADWPYLPKMYVKLGDVLLKLARTSDAIMAYTKALNENPEYISAYVALADYMAQSGAKVKALEYLTEGLRRQPESKLLKRRYNSLGGKQPYPEPYPKPVKDPDSRREHVAAPVAENRGENSNAVVTPAAAQAAEPNAAPVDSAVRGTPTNPYCRFCTEESK